MPVPVIQQISNQQVVFNTNFTINVTITGITSGNTIKVTGSLRGYLQSWDQTNNRLSITGTASSLRSGDPFTISATNSDGTSTLNRSLTVVKTQPIIQDPGTITVYRGLEFSQEIVISNNPDSVDVEGLYSGLSHARSANGVTVSGTLPSSAVLTVSSDTWIVKATTSNITTTRNINVTFSNSTPVTISAPSTISGTAGVALSQTITVGGTPIPTLTSTDMPSGLTFAHISGNTYRISGTPASSGNTSVTLTATRGSTTVIHSLTISIGAQAAPTLSSISNLTLVNLGAVSQSISNLATVTGAPSPSVSLSGAPTGVSISKSGNKILLNISSVSATNNTTHNITVTATNVAGSVNRSFTLTIVAVDKELYIYDRDNRDIRIYASNTPSNLDYNGEPPDYKRIYASIYSSINSQDIALDSNYIYTILSGSSEKVRVWNKTTGALIRTFTITAPSGSQFEGIAVDDSYVYVVSESSQNDRQIRRYDKTTANNMTASIQREFRLPTLSTENLYGILAVDDTYLYVLYATWIGYIDKNSSGTPSSWAKSVGFNSTITRKIRGMTIYDDDFYLLYLTNDNGLYSKMFVADSTVSNGTTLTASREFEVTNGYYRARGIAIEYDA